jgi:hypothetical protein
LLRALPVGAGYPAPRFEEDGAEDDSAGRGAGAGMLATRLCFLPQAPANRQQATSATLAVSDLRRGITFSSSFNSPGARNLQLSHSSAEETVPCSAAMPKQNWKAAFRGLLLASTRFAKRHPVNFFLDLSPEQLYI